MKQLPATTLAATDVHEILGNRTRYDNLNDTSKLHFLELALKSETYAKLTGEEKSFLIEKAVQFIYSISFNSDVQNVTMVIGKTGAGKGTLINYLGGANIYIKCEKYCFLDTRNPVKDISIGHGFKSDTFLPVSYVDEENHITYFDCPGFKDSRGLMHEIINAIHIEQVISHAKKIRFVLVVTEQGFADRVNVDELKFSIDSLAGYTREFDKFKDSILLVITKKGMAVIMPEYNLRLMSTPQKDQIGLHEVIIFKANDKVFYENHEKEPLELKPINIGEVEFEKIRTILRDPETIANKVLDRTTEEVVLRFASNSGYIPTEEMSYISHIRDQIQAIIEHGTFSEYAKKLLGYLHNNPARVQSTFKMTGKSNTEVSQDERKNIITALAKVPYADKPIDFHMEFSDEVKLRIGEFVRRINDDVTAFVERLGEAVQTSFANKTKGCEDVYVLRQALVKMCEIIDEIIKGPRSSHEPYQDLAEFYAIITKKLDSFISQADLATMSNQTSALRLFEKINPNQKVYESATWLRGLQTTSSYLNDAADWYFFTITVYETLAGADVQLNRKTHKEANYDKFITQETGKEKASISDDNLLEFFVGNFTKQYHSFFSHNVTIMKTNPIIGQEQRIQEINHLLTITLIDPVVSHFDDLTAALFVQCNFPHISEIKSKLVHYQFKSLYIYGTNTVFIDADLADDRWHGVNIQIISPKWYVSGTRTISINGVAAIEHSLSKAANAEHQGVNGMDGLPGNPGGSGGHFLGLGLSLKDNDFAAHLSRLSISANGAKGGEGQDGGNGVNGKDGEDADLGSTAAFTEIHPMYPRALFETIFVHYGEKGAKGSDGGKGGSGGKGGLAGSIHILDLNKSKPDITVTKNALAAGPVGKDGAPGHPGEGGKDGKMILKSYYNYYTPYAVDFIVGMAVSYCTFGVMRVAKRITKFEAEVNPKIEVVLNAASIIISIIGGRYVKSSLGSHQYGPIQDLDEAIKGFDKASQLQREVAAASLEWRGQFPNMPIGEARQFIVPANADIGNVVHEAQSSMTTSESLVGQSMQRVRTFVDNIENFEAVKRDYRSKANEAFTFLQAYQIKKLSGAAEYIDKLYIGIVAFKERGVELLKSAKNFEMKSLDISVIGYPQDMTSLQKVLDKLRQTMSSLESFDFNGKTAAEASEFIRQHTATIETVSDGLVIQASNLNQFEEFKQLKESLEQYLSDLLGKAGVAEWMQGVAYVGQFITAIQFFGTTAFVYYYSGWRPSELKESLEQAASGNQPSALNTEAMGDPDITDKASCLFQKYETFLSTALSDKMQKALVESFLKMYRQHDAIGIHQEGKANNYCADNHAAFSDQNFYLMQTGVDGCGEDCNY